MSCCHNECSINHIDEFENNKSLYNYIDKDRIECYNFNNNFPISNCIKPYSDRHNNLYLESDCDEQLIIRIPFSNGILCSCNLCTYTMSHLFFCFVFLRKPMHH